MPSWFSTVPLPIALLLAVAVPGPACGAEVEAAGGPAAGADLGVADLADLALEAPIVAEAVVVRVTRVRDATVPPGAARGYVEAALAKVLRAPSSLGAEQGWLVDAPPTALRGLKRRRVLVFARPVAGRAGQLQLIAPDAQIDWTPERAMTVRRLLTEAAAPGAPPKITGVGRAFHTPGAVEGEGQTQLFLHTDSGEPVSLTVVRRPGRAASWSLATGDVVGAAAEAPTRDGLAWFRLACGLPQALPEDSLPADERHSRAVQADYRFVLDSLGPCGRTRAGSVKTRPAARNPN